MANNDVIRPIDRSGKEEFACRDETQGRNEIACPLERVPSHADRLVSDWAINMSASRPVGYGVIRNRRDDGRNEFTYTTT